MTSFLDRLRAKSAQKQTDDATALIRYRELILAGGPTSKQEAELAKITEQLGLDAEAVTRDLQAVTDYQKARRERPTDDAIEAAQRAATATAEAINAEFDRAWKAKNDCEAAHSSASLELMSLESQRDRMDERADQIEKQNPRLWPAADPVPA